MTVPIPLRWLLTLGLIALIVMLSIAPGQAKDGDSGFAWLVAITPALLQKSMHFAAYAALAALWYWTLESIPSRSPRVAIVLLLSLALGVILEWAQTHIPGRFGTLTDIVLNAAGTLVGLGLAMLCPRISQFG